MDTPDNSVDVDSLDIVELQMALEEALDRDLTEAETQELTNKLRVLLKSNPNGLDDDNLLPSLVRILGPRTPLPGKSDSAAVRPEQD